MEYFNTTDGTQRGPNGGQRVSLRHHIYGAERLGFEFRLSSRFEDLLRRLDPSVPQLHTSRERIYFLTRFIGDRFVKPLTNFPFSVNTPVKLVQGHGEPTYTLYQVFANMQKRKVGGCTASTHCIDCCGLGKEEDLHKFSTCANIFSEGSANSIPQIDNKLTNVFASPWFAYHNGVEPSPAVRSLFRTLRRMIVQVLQKADKCDESNRAAVIPELHARLLGAAANGHHDANPTAFREWIAHCQWHASHENPYAQPAGGFVYLFIYC